MPDTIIVPQPLGFPAPFVALAEDQTECYGNPVFLYEATSESAGSISVFGYQGTTTCGVGYRYQSCNHAHAMAVVYPPASQPHTSMSFGGTCWALDGSISDLRPYKTVGVSDVIPVSSCADIACTGSNPYGSSVLYMDPEAKAPVTVQFEHLDRGIPAFGVASENFSTGYAQTPPGRIQYLIWDQRSIPIFTATETAKVLVKIDPIDISRDLVIVRGGQRGRFTLSPGIDSIPLSLQAGDTVSLEFGNNANRYRGKSGQVTWSKVVPLPHLYDTAALVFSGSQAITAVGFTGLTNRQDYTFFSAVPASVQMDLPNPDTVVTVQDSFLPEMELVRAQAVNEEGIYSALRRYAGQKLSSPVSIRFYASRSRAGQHGEMDVWLDTDQVFPACLKVSPYKALVYGGYSYRKNASPDDTTRRGLRVAQFADAENLKSPGIYVSDSGERISAAASQNYVFLNSVPYYFSGTLDAGISDTVYSGLEELSDPRHHRQYGIVGTPHGIVYVPATDEIWAATTSGIEIMPGAGSATTAILVASSPNYDIAWCAATGEVFVARLDGTVVGYNPKTRLPTKTGSIGSPAGAIVRMAVRGSEIYVGANMPNATLLKLSSADLSVAASYSSGIPVSVYGVVYVSGCDKVLLGTESGGCWLLSPDGAFVNANVPSTTAWGFCDAPDRGSYYVASASFPGGLREMDPTGLASLKLIPTTYSSRNPFWHPIRRKIYYGQYVVGTEEIRDPNGNLLSSVYVGEWTYASAYAPLSRLVFVTLPSTNLVVAMT